MLRHVTIFLAVALYCSLLANGQIASSLNQTCTVAPVGMACNGIGEAVKSPKQMGKHSPPLSVTHMMLEAGASLESAKVPSDFLIVGISGGELLNEQTRSSGRVTGYSEVNGK